MPVNVGEIWSALRVDGSKAPADAAKAGQKAGESAGISMKKAMVGVGAAISGALSVALVGRFAALERAQAEFRRETGATAEEAERAGKAINDMAGRNLQPIEEIGRTLSKVTTDLGLTGDEAATTTEQFLKFARATGQDAATAVEDFDDILDAWGLTAEESAGIMDQLVASHQEYGGSVSENQQALGRLAPALKAMNLSIDDGVGLLNLFADSGIDAAAAQRGLNGAITKLPPGEDFIEFTERIASIADPTERARQAVQVMGSQMGVKLANALGPGRRGLDSYIIKAEEVPGATTAAADASLTMVDRIRLGFDNFLSDAVEALGPAGPLLTAVGSLGTLFAPLLGKALTGAVMLGKTAIAGAGVLAGAIFAGGELAGGFLGTFANKIKMLLPIILKSAIANLGTLGWLGIAATPRDDATASQIEHVQGIADRLRAEREAAERAASEGGTAAAAGWLDAFHGTWESESRRMSLSDDWVVKPAEAIAATVEQTAVVVTGAWGTIAEIDYGAPARAVAKMTRDIFQTLGDAKDPFKDEEFADWMANKARHFAEKAARQLRNGKEEAARASQALADVMSNPILYALAETQAEIAALVRAMAAVNLMEASTGTFRMGSQAKVAGRAHGGYASGLTMVGERGFELVDLPSGSYVHDNEASKAMMASASAPAGDINLYVHTDDGQRHDLSDQLRRALQGASESAHIRYMNPQGA
jgi:hypothetical protein